MEEFEPTTFGILAEYCMLIQKSHFDSFKGLVFLTPGRPLQESHFDFFWVDTCKGSL